MLGNHDADDDDDDDDDDWSLPLNPTMRMVSRT